MLKTNIISNDRDGAASTTNSVIGAIAGIGALVIGSVGLAAAYDSDREGKLIHKGTLGEAKDVVRRFLRW